MQQQWAAKARLLAAVASSLTSLAEKCTTMKQLKRIHAQAIRTGLHFHTLILAKMLRFTAVSPSGDLFYAHRLFYQMPKPNTFFYNTLIRGYSKSHFTSNAICLFNQMRLSCVPPDEFTFTFLLKAHSRNSGLLINGVDDIHGQVLKFGFGSHLFVQNALIHLYATKGICSLAHKVFEEIFYPDVVSWSGLLVAHVKAGELDNARRVFDRMPVKDVVSWTTMISGYSQAKRSLEALELFGEMQSAGVRPDEVTMVSVISACTILGNLEAGLSVHSYIDENGFGWMISLSNALIDMYAKCGCVDGARRVFDKMGRKSLITWNSMISACANHGNVQDAVGLFHKMSTSGVNPDGVTFLALLGAYTHIGFVDEGYRLFESMQNEYGIEAGIEHYGCVVDMLGRAGRLEEAYGLILTMPIPSNDVVWGALLAACRIYGNVDMGERVVKKLLELKPDEGGYYILLCDIYDAAGRRAEAIKMRQTMKTVGAKKNPGCSWVGS
ncbi:hypothetical protein AQUCO_07200089v1 [Aquilegia coerulea]|uniref:Pentacotripeptide-repeat region of PRORP domain-containing protein n=1 Tax=Aquilegia coerulea TaxID=218851 RepID=A0A2G5CAA0_AQUCA|nr:hypothetical protein AQUCO_07200089v1 [Aquilegia coerulea]